MRSNKPIIGITLSEMLEDHARRKPTWKPFDYLKREYHEAIQKSGGIPILLPNAHNPVLAREVIDEIDGLLLTGGGDLHPSYFGQEPHPKLTETTANRDSFEMALTRLVIEADKPVMAICRGHQVLNVALGGTLHQDLSCLSPGIITHADPGQTARVFHEVAITAGSLLHRIVGADLIETNSSHHQVIDRPGEGLKFVAYAREDNVPEAIEHIAKRFVLGLQWHPEAIFDREHSRRIFRAFVEAAGQK
jgi:putative glutamine amidotransferase